MRTYKAKKILKYFFDFRNFSETVSVLSETTEALWCQSFIEKVVAVV
jgi:hypothetical protein